jgi:hypothetical protein
MDKTHKLQAIDKCFLIKWIKPVSYLALDSVVSEEVQMTLYLKFLLDAFYTIPSQLSSKIF